MLQKVSEVVKFVTHHQKALARYRELAADLPKTDRPPGGTELLRACDTRFASNIMMLIRYKNVQDLLEQLVIDKSYVQWLEKQSREMKDNGAKIKDTIRNSDVKLTVDIGIAVMEPVLRLLRLTDGKTGATLSKVYGYLLQLDEHFRNPIEGLDSDEIRHKIHELFMARWEYMHVPAMTAAYRLDPEFARRKFSRDEQAEVKSVLKQMATTEHPYPDMLSELADFEEALRAGLQDLDNNVAFSSKARNMAPYKCIQMGHGVHVTVAQSAMGGHPPARAVLLCVGMRALVVGGRLDPQQEKEQVGAAYRGKACAVPHELVAS